MAFSSSFVVCLALLACTAVEAGKVSPVQKVIELLDQLKAKVKGDLDTEAKAMEEYSSWCDKEIGDKGYAIQTAARQISDYKAAMEENDAISTAKEAEIAELGAKISEKEEEVASAAKERATERENFKAAEAELMTSVDELAGGIVQMKRGASLVQVQKQMQPVADNIGRIIEASSVQFAKRRGLGTFLQSHENDDLSLRQPQGEQEAYGSQSGGIIQTLEDMKAKAEDQLSAARKGDMESNHEYEMVKMSLENEIRNMKKALADAKATRSSTAQEQAKARGELAEVEKSKAADEEYLANTKMECQTKAEEWTQRQKEAAGEMGAIAKAKEILATGVKAAFVQVAVRTHTRVGAKDEEDAEANKRDSILSKLESMAREFHSLALTQLASRARADPFAKIKVMINQMIEKLLNEANEEATHKAFCDEEMGKSTKAREDKTRKLDKFTSRLNQADTNIAEINEAIKTLEGEIAEIDAALAEASKIRNEEHEAYLKASKDFGDSAEAVGAAMQVLKSYYEGSFLQLSARTRRASAKQPELGGASSDVGGTIISVLEVAESDFDRLLAEAETDEQSASTAFAKLEQESKVSKAAKAAEIKGKDSEMKALTTAVENYKEDKTSVGEELDAVMAYLDKLKPECESKAMSYEEKVARRKAEIEGLKDAMNILEGEDIPALVQLRASRRFLAVRKV